MEVHASFCLLYSSLHFPNTPESISMEANDAVCHWGIDVRDGGGLMSGTEVGWMDGGGGVTDCGDGASDCQRALLSNGH